MVKLIPIPFERDKFALRVERVKDDRIWYFDTEIPGDQWELCWGALSPAILSP